MKATSGKTRSRWLTPATGSIGLASFLSDAGHEIPTSLLPSFLTATLGAPAAALGVIEGVADGMAGAAKLAGGALADDPHRRRAVAIGGYTATAILSSAIGVAVTPLQVGILRTGAWVARGVRGPARNALLADVTGRDVYGKAYGFERMMDNLGAIVGPLLALVLISLVGVRTAIVLSIIPGLGAALAIAYAAHRVATATTRERRPIRLQVRAVLRGRLGRLFVGIGAFELGNAAVTLMILRATELLVPDHGEDAAVQIALLLYVGYNVAATAASLPGGRLSDRRSPTHALVVGAASFLVAYLLFAVGGAVPLLFVGFVLAGIGIGLVETAEASAVATFSEERVRGSAFGLLAGAQSIGNLTASVVGGILWTVFSPTVAFAYFAAWMALAVIALATAPRNEPAGEPRMIDPDAIAAGWDIVKRLGPDHARTLLAVLELPGDARWAFTSSMYQREDGLALAEVLARRASSRRPSHPDSDACLGSIGRV